jgi:hypothetical protein
MNGEHSMSKRNDETHVLKDGAFKVYKCGSAILAVTLSVWR